MKFDYVIFTESIHRIEEMQAHMDAIGANGYRTVKIHVDPMTQVATVIMERGQGFVGGSPM